MLNLLRRIPFPENVKIHSAVIRGKTLRFAKNHHEILEFARGDAREIVGQAKLDAEEIRNSARQELANSMQKDVQALGYFTNQRVQGLTHHASNICIDICNTALREFLGELPEPVKINKLVTTLLDRSLNTQHLLLECAEEQLETVQTCLGDIMAQQVSIRHWEVKVSDDLQPFELRIRAAKGSEINVSMDNLIALYAQEIKNLEREIAASINSTGEQYEKVD